MQSLLKKGNNMNNGKAFYKSLFALVIPIAIQNLITSAVNSADVFMLGFVGQAELSAVSLANQVQFLLSGLFFGITSGIVMLCSQYWGKKDTDTIQKVMGIAFKVAFTFCVIFALAAICFPKEIMLIYTNDMSLVEIGVGYLRIISISYILLAFSQVYLSVLRSVERANISTIISSVALITNVVLNAVFIFGLFGAPKLGVIGVAVATTIARIIEVILCLWDLCHNKVFKFNIKFIIKWDKLLFFDYIKYSIPALLNDIAWTFAFSTYSIIMGHLNADVVAANSVVSTVRNLCSVLCFGIAAGGTVLIGKAIGENRLEDAKVDAGRLVKASVTSGIITGVVLLLVKPIVFECFILSERAYEYLNYMLIINSYYIVGQVFNTVTIAGIFRAGGDSKFGMICDTITMWVIAVPLGFIAAFVLKLPPMAVYFILCLDEFWKIPVVIKHYKSYKWLKNITR